jgi:hypothetical protein
VISALARCSGDLEHCNPSARSLVVIMVVVALGVVIVGLASWRRRK